MSRLTEARGRLAALRAAVGAILIQIRRGDIADPEQLEHQLLGYREHEMELVAEIAFLESAGGDDDGSAGALVPRPPRPLPMQGAGAMPIPVDDDTAALTSAPDLDDFAHPQCRESSRSSPAGRHTVTSDFRSANLASPT